MNMVIMLEKASSKCDLQLVQWLNADSVQISFPVSTVEQKPKRDRFRLQKFGYGGLNPELPRSWMRGGNVSHYTIPDVRSVELSRVESVGA